MRLEVQPGSWVLKQRQKWREARLAADLETFLTQFVNALVCAMTRSEDGAPRFIEVRTSEDNLRKIHDHALELATFGELVPSAKSSAFISFK